MKKMSYTTPQLIIFGTVEELTRGPVNIFPNDNIIGQGNGNNNNNNSGCGGGGPKHSPCPGS
jgi:hypothetical protein